MGRKGFKSFVKASAKPPSDNEAEVAPAASDTAPAAPAAPVKQQVAAKPAKQQAAAAAAPPKVAAPKAADSGSGDGSGSEEGPGDGPETRGQMLQRHKREMLAHKKALQRSGKKSKDDITKATADLEKRHAAELKALDDAGSEATVAAAGGGSTAAGAAKAAAGSDAATAGGATGDAATAADPLSKYMVDLGLGGGGAGKARPTKAQKRREKHAVRDAEREARIAAEKDALGTPERLAEEAALRALLAPLGLAIREIRADGHCMYRSLEDQLRQAAAAAGCGGASGGDGGDGDGGGEGDGDDATPSVQELRELAAEHIRSHRDQFAAFVVPEDDAEDPAAFFERYCDEIEDTAVWGSHVELTALAGALGRRITVYAVGMAPQVLGEEHGGPGLAVCFLRHALGLGDHFNSTQPLLHASAGGEGDESEAGGSGAGSE